MSLFSYLSELKMKQMGLVALLSLAVCLTAFAQAPAITLPPLPGVASIEAGSTPEVTADVALPEINLPGLPSPNAAAPLPALPAPVATADQKAEATKPATASISPLPPVTSEQHSTVPSNNTVPTLPAVEVEASKPTESTTQAGPLPAPLPSPEADSAPPLPAMLPLPLPGQAEPVTPQPAQITDATGTNSAQPETKLPVIEDVALPKQAEAKEPEKSWQTKLEPTVIPMKTDFNYKRQILPNVIYRADYNRDNMHLPRRLTREDYAALLFTSVANNDIEATRALLNAGTAINAKNAYGETPLEFAKRVGAFDVAALLKARGAN